MRTGRIYIDANGVIYCLVGDNLVPLNTSLNYICDGNENSYTLDGGYF